VDLNKLAVPLEGGAGRFLRYDPVYDEIREARSEEDASLSRGIWARELKKADWSEVLRLCQKVLETETKDLQIVGWLCEALCHLEKWEGMNKAFAFITEFCHQCWEVCFPVLEDSTDLEPRLRIFEWFLGQMQSVLLFFPIVSPSDLISSAVTLAAWREAVNLDFIARRTGGGDSRLNQMEKENILTLKRCRTFVRQAFVDDINKTLHLCQGIRKEAHHLELFLKNKCAEQEPPFSKFYEQIKEVEKICEYALEGRIAEDNSIQQSLDVSGAIEGTALESQESGPGPESPPEPEAVPLASEPATPNEVTISNKKDAYQAVSDLADYLLEVDPQNPSPYIIKMVSSWGDKALPSILDELTEGKGEGHKILRMLSDWVKEKRE
jgi:type VI secretion system ImpA family protein